MRTTLFAAVTLAFGYSTLSWACGPYPCAGVWGEQVYDTRTGPTYELKLGELIEGRLRDQGLIETYFPAPVGAPPVRPQDGDVYITIAERKKRLESVFARLGIQDSELPAAYKQLDHHIRTPERVIAYAEGMLAEGMSAAAAKKLVLLRERITTLSASDEGRAADLSEVAALPADTGFAGYLQAIAAQTTWETATPESLERFVQLSRGAKSAWVREHALLSAISSRVALLADLHQKDSKPLSAATVQPLLDDIQRFEQGFGKSALLGAVARYRLAAFALQDQKAACLDTLASLTQKALADRAAEDLWRINLAHVLEVCAPGQPVRWEAPLVAALMPLAPDHLPSALSKLEAARAAYASLPGLYAYQRARIFLAQGKHEQVLGETQDLKYGTPLSLVMGIQRYHAQVGLKQYDPATQTLAQMAKARAQEGALRLLGIRARVISEDWVALAQDPMLKSPDVWAWTLYHNATDDQIAALLGRIDAVPAALRAAMFDVALTRLAPQRKFAAFDGLKGKESYLRGRRPVLAAIHRLQSALQDSLQKSLQKSNDPQSLMTVGDALRRVRAESAFLSAECFVDTIGSRTAFAQNGAGAVEPWTPYAYYKAALTELKRVDQRQKLEPKILFSLVSCYKQSNDWYPCQPHDGRYDPADPLEQRERWFKRLKSKYARSEQAKSLRYYW